MEYLHKNFDELRYGSKEKEAMVDPEGNAQYGDESKEIALDPMEQYVQRRKRRIWKFWSIFKP